MVVEEQSQFKCPLPEDWTDKKDDHNGVVELYLEEINQMYLEEKFQMLKTQYLLSKLRNITIKQEMCNFK